MSSPVSTHAGTHYVDEMMRDAIRFGSGTIFNSTKVVIETISCVLVCEWNKKRLNGSVRRSYLVWMYTLRFPR